MGMTGLFPNLYIQFKDQFELIDTITVQVQYCKEVMGPFCLLLVTTNIGFDYKLVLI